MTHRQPRHLVPVKPLRLNDTISEDQVAYLQKKLIGSSNVMHALKNSITLAASSSETVLITGESGTGKELIANAIHDLSARRHGPFLAINCGALTESLLESELFGHVKGAFTGATANKRGFFEAAGQGTIFLDEFAEMSPATQAKLLRVLEERKVRPVGMTEAKEVQINARVVVATNHDLKKDVNAGRFRSDLYYRVNVLRICAPSLRARCEDVEDLAKHFIQKFNERNGCNISDHISSDVLNLLQRYAWPGNVRELENIINRLANTVGENGFLSAEDLLTDKEIRAGISKDPRSALRNVTSIRHHANRKELDRYQRLLKSLGGNMSEAARLLKVPRTTLQSRVIILKERCERL